MDRPLFAALDRFIAPLGKGVVMASAVASIAVLGAADVLTGSEISFSIFYVVPVSLAAWYAGVAAGVAIAVVSAATWLAADLGAGASYSGALIPYWNSLVRLGYFLIIARLLVLLRQRLELEERLAATDPLTGLDNGRAFLEALGAEQARAFRYRHAFTLAYIDLDDFKAVNDRFGHAAGDRLIREIGAALGRSVRRTDRVGRLGGDEFAVLLPETDADAAAPALAKIQQAVQAAVAGGEWGVGASVGGVTFAAAPGSAEAALKAADALMYEAKRSGKNQVVHRVADGSLSGTAPEPP